jgi:transposase
MKFHGVDRHKRYWTISQRDERCQEVGFVAHQWDVEGYLQGLGREDVVALEASSGTFCWADRIEARGARCVVVDPYRFRIIRDSWNKTDRRDAVNLSLGLWMAQTRGECRLPEVYKPSVTVRQLRQLFGQWQIVNKQVRQLKSQIQGVLTEEGVPLDHQQAQRLVDTPAGAQKILEALDLSAVSRFCIQMSLKLLAGLLEQKELLRVQILRAGRPLESQVKLLIGIRGITPLLALAFLAEVGDIRRFTSLRRLNAYLGVVPRIHSSGGITRVGHLNRSSRSLARSLFTQAIPHLADSSPELGKWYEGLAERKGKGRARIGVLRRVFGIMRRMLLKETEYRWLEPVLYKRKLREYQRIMEKAENIQEVA